MTDEIIDVHDEPTDDKTFDVTSQDQEPQQEQHAASPYETIIEQQKTQIDALIEHTEQLNAQIAQMIRGGAQLRDVHNGGKTEPSATDAVAFNPVSLEDSDYSLEALGKEIGKR